MESDKEVRSESQKWRVQRDGDKDLVFRGVRLAAVSSREMRGPNQNRWTEIEIYRTVGGKYVVHIVGRSMWQGESDRHKATVCATQDDIVEELYQEGEDGNYLSNLAKEALEEAGIECTEEIE